MAKIFKVNEAIDVVYGAVGATTGISDLTLTPTNPSGSDGTPTTMTEVSNGLYKGTFTPNVTGRWKVRITSVSEPENGSTEYYWVGTHNILEGQHTILYDSSGNELLGQKTVAGSIPVTMASNQDPINVVIPPSEDNITISIGWNKDHTAINASEWQELVEYTVPTGYDLSAVQFSGKSEVADEIAVALSKFALGSFVGSTNTFTDGDAISAPKFSCSMYLYVTTAIGAGSDDVITVTYTNEIGTTGRTATATLTKSSLVGTRVQVQLQTGDLGVRDVTNVTHSATDQAGDFNVEGCTILFRETMTTANIQYNANSVSLGGIVVLEDEKVYLWYFSNTKSTNQRNINLVGTLVPRPT